MKYINIMNESEFDVIEDEITYLTLLGDATIEIDKCRIWNKDLVSGKMTEI